jgi:hypothetical protein
MAVTIIPNVTNWTVTPQNGQVGYFTLMNTWLGQSTTVIASLQTAVTAQNTANSEINALAIQVANDTVTTVAAKDEAVSALAILATGSINDTIIGVNKVYSNQKTNELLALKLDKDINSLTAKTTPADADNFVISDSAVSHALKKLTWANIKATILSSFGVMINTATAKTTPADADIFIIADSASSNATKKTTWANLKATLLTYFDNLYSRTTAIFGIGQTWQDVTASRVAGVSYTNTSGKPIMVTIGFREDTNLPNGIIVNDISVGNSSSTASANESSVSAIVPNDNTYGYPIGIIIVSWSELR